MWCQAAVQQVGKALCISLEAVSLSELGVLGGVAVRG